VADAVGPVTVTYSTPSESQFALGTTDVSVTAVDAAGNRFVGTLAVTVRDTTAPTIVSTSGDLTVEATSSTGAVVAYRAATATDAVSPVTISYSQASGVVFALGTTTVTVTATDAAGNVSTRTFRITVRDTTPPQFTFVPPTLTVDATSAGGAVVRYPAAMAVDAAGPVTLTYSIASGSVFRVGWTHVVVTAVDAAGNRTTAGFDVHVRR
jgi:hypothetical protein